MLLSLFFSNKKKFGLFLLTLLFIVNFLYSKSHTYLSKTAFNIISFADDGTNVWIGGYGQGLLKINKNTQEIQLYHCFNSGIPSNHIWSIAIDNQKNVWCGTWGGGLTMFNGK
jgi:ligand-binding sensor domain-containing protein